MTTPLVIFPPSLSPGISSMQGAKPDHTAMATVIEVVLDIQWSETFFIRMERRIIGVKNDDIPNLNCDEVSRLVMLLQMS